MRTRLLIFISVLSVVVSMTVLGTALASRSFQAGSSPVPPQLMYQAFLRDAKGEPVSGPVNLTFNIYPSCSSNAPLWEEQHREIAASGFVSLLLGSVNNPLTARVFESGESCVGIAVGLDPELKPRQLLTTVPYAFVAEQASRATMAEDTSRFGGMTRDKFRERVDLTCPPGSVISQILADDTVVCLSIGVSGEPTEPGVSTDLTARQLPNLNDLDISGLIIPGGSTGSQSTPGSGTQPPISQITAFQSSISASQTITGARLAGLGTLGPRADLSITMNSSPNPVKVGQNLSYIMTVTNNGPEDATNVMVTSPLPFNASLLAFAKTQGNCNDRFGPFSCDLGNMAVGDSASVTMVVRPLSAGQITSTADVTSTEADPNNADNTAVENIVVNSGSGAIIWIGTFDVPCIGCSGLRTQGFGVTANSSDVYIAGETSERYQIREEDPFLARYNSGGSKLYVNRFDQLEIMVPNAQGNVTQRIEPSNGALDVTLDGNGDLYVAGYTRRLEDPLSQGAVGLGDLHMEAFLTKVSPSSSEIWTREFGSSDSSNVAEGALGVAADGDGNAYVSGLFGSDAFFRRYNPDGSVSWTKTFRSFNSSVTSAAATDAAALGLGDVVVAGISTIHANDTQVFVRKYSRGGILRWGIEFGNNSIDEARGVALDGSGNVYVVGFTDGALPGQAGEGGADAFVRKLNPFGSEIWTRQFGTSGADWASGVAVDASGNVYVTGSTNGALPGQVSAGANDSFLRKYDSNGNEVWTTQFGTSANDSALDAVLDGSGNIYLSGKIGRSIDAMITKIIQ